MARIQYSTPEGASGDVELTAESMTLGRADDNAIVINDGSVSSHHAEIVFDGATWTLNDLGSTNGTKIGGERVEQLQLTHGGAFTLGSVECVFIGDVTEEETAAAYSSGAAASAVTLDGYGALPYDGSLRTGFGPKTKVKSGGAGALMLLGGLAIVACAVAIFMFTGMAG